MLGRPPRPHNVRNGRGLPTRERGGLKKRVQLRLGTINIGTMTGRSRELADSLKARCVDIACIQETKWKGTKARNIGEGYKFICNGKLQWPQNGVGIVVSERLRDSVVEVIRTSDRLMSIKIDTGSTALRVVSCYAPQTNCANAEKDQFWETMDGHLRSFGPEQYVAIGGDLRSEWDMSGTMVVKDSDRATTLRWSTRSSRKAQSRRSLWQKSQSPSRGWRTERHRVLTTSLPKTGSLWVALAHQCYINKGDYDYDYDVRLADEDRATLQLQTQQWKFRLDTNGMRLNMKKTEYMGCGVQTDGTINVGGEDLEKSTEFRYLGSVLSSDGDLLPDIRARVNAAWAKWRQVTGVLCDRRMPIRLKAKVYKTIVHPVALYGAECWPATAKHERILHNMEMRMLRWCLGLTRWDCIMNTNVRKLMGVAPITEKMQEARMRWYGHVVRSGEDSVARTALRLSPQGKRPRGRPKKRWIDRIKEDVKIVGAAPEDALDRAKWRRLCKKADPASARD
ncbi:uncharacterized protein [Garra rufa]|uniref:uncharacterized protein n=1 Tax=Garra rufa TaxID=137080 RepID=UPI003CCECF30